MTAMRYCDVTPERLACLRAVEAAGGQMNHEDPALEPFCDDASTLSKPDVFNQCHDAGWLTSSCGSVVADDDCLVYLTDAGRAVLKRAAELDGRTDDDDWAAKGEPSLDCTGDLLDDLVAEHGLALSDRYKADPDNEYERDTLVYLNADQTVKVVCHPRWYPSEGNIYAVAVFEKAEPTPALGMRP